MAHFIEKVCERCGLSYQTLYKHRNKRRFCSRKCVNEAQTGEGNPAFGKTYCTKEKNPEWAQKIGEGCKGLNSGDANGMKKADVRKRASETRRKKMEDPDFRKVFSEGTRRAWAEGKFDGVRVGQCKWYAHTRPDGSVVHVQGTWEIAFVKWADQNGMKYQCHRGRIPYVDECGIARSYYPDFFVYDWDSWVDVKNDYHYHLQEAKFCAIRNTKINLRILRRQDLISLGVQLKGRAVS